MHYFGCLPCHTWNVGVRVYCTAMNATLIVAMEALWPELPGQRRPYEVLLTVPRDDKGEPLVPRELPPEVLGCWPTDTVSATVLASRPSRAVAAVEALVPELAGATGAAVTVRDAGAGRAGSATKPGFRTAERR